MNIFTNSMSSNIYDILWQILPRGMTRQVYFVYRVYFSHMYMTYVHLYVYIKELAFEN